MTETLRLDGHWLGEPREYVIDEKTNVVYIKVGEKKWRIDRAETERRRAMDQRATSTPGEGREHGA